MKKIILTIAAAALMMGSCAKQKIQPKVDANENLRIKFGNVLFYTLKDQAQLSIKIAGKTALNNFVTKVPECGDFHTLMIPAGVQTYTVYSILNKFVGNNTNKNDTTTHVGSIDLKEGECLLVNIQ